MFATQMYEKLTPQWASTLLGIVSLVMMPVPLVLRKYGPMLRARSRNAPTSPKETLAIVPEVTKEVSV